MKNQALVRAEKRLKEKESQLRKAKKQKLAGGFIDRWVEVRRLKKTLS